MKLLITGGPNTGKTTYANTFREQHPVFHADDLAHLGWSESSEALSQWFDREGDWVIEGVSVPRALRKWLMRNADNSLKPCDVVHWCTVPKAEVTKGQRSMLKGLQTVWNEIVWELTRRGVEIRFETIESEQATQGNHSP